MGVYIQKIPHFMFWGVNRLSIVKPGFYNARESVPSRAMR